MNNKTSILILSLSFMCMAVSAQEEYYPFITTGKVWEMQLDGFTDIVLSKRILYLEGDTIINGVNYIICNMRDGQTDATFYRAMREQDGKVYCILAGEDKEHLMFDFGMHIGDSVYCETAKTYDGGFLYDGSIDETGESFVRIMHLSEIDTFTHHGMRLKKYHFTVSIKERMANGYMEEHEDFPETWVEGIGSLGHYPFNAWDVPMLSSNYWNLMKCYDNFNTLFEVDASDFDEAMTLPNIAPIYDLQGRRLPVKPKKGIYILNGRKYLKK